MPWQMSYAASADLDNSELQTDVMRFMAILAFCLVAIFAIVQSMPLEARQKPQPVVAAPPPAAKPVRSEPVPGPQPQSAPAPRPVVTETRLEPLPRPAAPARRVVMTEAIPKPKAAKPEPRVVRTPAPKPVAPAPVRLPDTAPTGDFVSRQAETLGTPVVPVTAETSPPARRGLSLSFESDSVLRSLVERRLVGLYAIDGKDFYQMSVAAGQIRFAPGAAPARYHEMVYETVPADVARIFESQQAASGRDVVWGVTLPAGTTAQLRRFVQTRYTGDLVITADAQLALAGSG